MRKFLLATAIGALPLAAPLAPAYAGACATGANLGQWTVSGFSCTVGDKTFSNFTYVGTAGGGSTAIAAAEVDITVINNGSAGIGFLFSAPWTAASGESLDSLIGFQVAVTGGGPQQIHDAELVQSGSGFLAPGVGSVAENLSNNVNLLTVDDANQTILSDSQTFAPTGSVGVTKDISVNGNQGGFATISEVADTFSQTVPVPEPAGIALLSTGVLSLLWLRSRRHRSR